MLSVGTRNTSTSSHAVSLFPPQPQLSTEERLEAEEWDRLVLTTDFAWSRQQLFRSHVLTASASAPEHSLMWIDVDFHALPEGRSLLKRNDQIMKRFKAKEQEKEKRRVRE
jgi:hypothetical protein